MRHIFDQYIHPENRLTHALVSGLGQDQKLLKKFVNWVTNGNFPRNSQFKIAEQTLPGDVEKEEIKVGERGLPDAWIYTEEGWALLIESKISAPVSAAQLYRHLKMADNRGFPDRRILLVTTGESTKRPIEQSTGRTWQDIYEWLCERSAMHDWARQIMTYMEVAEVKMAQSSYLKEGTLTKFTGIPFGRDYPFTYLEGKRLLGLILSLLKGKRTLQKIGVDPSISGRKAIRSEKGLRVWDFMGLKISKNANNFTEYPHLTIVLHADRVAALVTLPNGVKPSIRKQIFGKGKEHFSSLIAAIARNMEDVLKLDQSAQPYVKVLQRHYPSQSSLPVDDAVLRYDLRTVMLDGLKRPQKHQPEWLETTYAVMTNKESNIQFELGVEIHYSRSTVINTPKAIELLEQSFVALCPFLKMALKCEGVSRE